MKEAHQKTFIGTRTELPDAHRTPSPRWCPSRPDRGPLPTLAHAATFIIFFRSFCIRSAHELAQLPFEGLVAKARPRRAGERMLLEKAFWSTRYVGRTGYFKIRAADLAQPLTPYERKVCLSPLAPVPKWCRTVTANRGQNHTHLYVCCHRAS